MIRTIEDRDFAAVRAVVTAAFGQAEEADLVERLRADGDALVELVAAPGGEVAGHVLFSRLALVGVGEALAAAALAPVSVAPAMQSGGMGGALIRAGLERCGALGLAAVVVLGHPGYYPRFGFSAEAARGLEAPFSGPAFMALELAPGALATPRRVRYAPGFGLD